MSDFNSAHSSPAPTIHRKRRRVDDDMEMSTPRYGSDEDDLKYRSSTRKSRRGSGHRRSHSSDGSADELGHAYHKRNRSRSSSLGYQRSSHSYDALSPPAYKPIKLKYKTKFILKGHRKGVSQVRFSPDGRWIASCSADGTIKVWDATNGQHMRTMEGHLAGVSTIAWSPDSNTIASGSDDKAIRLWNRATGKPFAVPLLGHHNYVYSLAFSPKGNMLVSGSYDEAVFLWDLRARRQMKSLPAHSDPVGGVDFIRDGTLVCSCSTDGLIRVWDTSTGQCLRTLVHEDNPPVTTVRFAPNGKYILAWTLDSYVRLWDYVSGTCKKTYQGHVNTKFSIGGAFGVSGSEAFVVSGSEDGNLVFWDVKTKDIIQKVGGHEGVVCWVDTSPQPNGAVVSGGMDGTVRIWVNVDEDDSEIFRTDDQKLGGRRDDTPRDDVSDGAQNVRSLMDED
ncbi:WD repeat domain 5B [Drepanopeziza brunnea f. sp. 'multigermtubi' MB_m1]|uniref:Mitochondrial division protein 1 n=1 Tax=Marssonina brunnea f. sp. multigermtubi (strain MB_m1) TaxID=1072389 RepID=K1X666_MARBU|nr:WD repeat domain 5B [Drepanopeziza brunnea f. sp. 'multigermtubi' MB_m1]EKD20611.1 WD repeat domain 5B [Drepanopeziza brunnea f. sp. 'multigermtubi' MB_m1]